MRKFFKTISVAFTTSLIFGATVAPAQASIVSSLDSFAPVINSSVNQGGFGNGSVSGNAYNARNAGKIITDDEQTVLDNINFQRSIRSISPIQADVSIFINTDNRINVLDRYDTFTNDSANVYELMYISDDFTVQDITQTWLNTPYHKAIMLNDRITKGGVAIKYDASRDAYLAIFQGDF